MALTPIKIKWSQQLEAAEYTSFVIETTALAHTYFVQNPVFMFHNTGSEDAQLEITYLLTLNSETDDPLHSGTFTSVVVDETIPAGGRYSYDFDGMQLDNNSNYSIKHTVKITNSGSSPYYYHSLLFGVTEVQTQFERANSVITNVS